MAVHTLAPVITDATLLETLAVLLQAVGLYAATASAHLLHGFKTPGIARGIGSTYILHTYRTNRRSALGLE